MHLSSAHAAAVAGAVIMFFFRTAAADFWVVTNEVNSGVDQEWPAPTVEDYFMLFENDPSCDDVMNSRIWDPMEDLSHDDDRGIRCDGCGTGISAGNAQVMEIRADNIHWTFYADRGGNLYTEEDEVRGYCEVNHDITYNCFGPGLPVASFKGISELRCYTDIMPEI